MKNMTLTQIADACHGMLFKAEGCSGLEVSGVVMDSRQVEKDYLFIAAKGERVDGHNFISEVFDKGALAVVCEKEPLDTKGPYILVENSYTALKEIAAWYRSQLEITVVGITGSVGKTSTKEFISSVLSQKYRVLKTEGNYNNEIGMPLTILKLREEHEIAVLEMGISDFGEMHRLSSIAKPNVCVLTNIGQCHLENLGTREGILKAKTEIFDFMDEKGSVIINGEDDMLSTLQTVKGKKPIRFGRSKSTVFPSKQLDNDIYASDIVSKGLLGSSCEIHRKPCETLVDKAEAESSHVTVAIPLPGDHMVLNALAATATGLLLGLNQQEIVAGIESVKPLGGRSNILKTDLWTIIDDCYNANPVSMKAALDLLSKADTRRVAILGDMFELGPKEGSLHYDIGSYAMESGAELLLCAGNLARQIFQGAKEALAKKKDSQKELYYYETRDELIEALPNILRLQDTILVKASHGMGFEHVVKALQ